MVSSYTQLYKSKEAQDARTPRAMHRLMDTLYFHGRKPFDPCPTAPTFDGLVVPWKRLNYVNCPFEQAAKWLEKAEAEAEGGRSTLVLLPARLNTAYFARALPKITAIHIWINRVAFPPFTQPLSHTILTLCYGAPWTPPAKNPALDVRRITADMWDIGPRADKAALLRCAQGVFGPDVKAASVTRLPTNGVCLTMLETEFAAGFRTIAAHCRRHRNVVVLVCTLTVFHTTYLRESVDLVRGVCLFRPRMHMNGVEMVASSQVLVVAGKAVRFRPHTRLPPTYLVQAHPHTIVDRV